MKAIVNLTDKIKLEIEEQKEMETLHKAVALSNPRQECNVCKATTGFYWTTNKDKEGNIYVNYKCKCGARSKLGQYKNSGYFWRDFEQWVPTRKAGDNYGKIVVNEEAIIPEE